MAPNDSSDPSDQRDRSASPLDATGRVVGPAATQAFKLLGDETRLAILLALWEAYDPFADDNAVSFTDLMDRVGYDTSGNFSYHLEKLVGTFVAETEDGYRLRQAGHRIVRAVVAGTGIANATLEPTDIDLDCTVCGGPLAITYEHEHLYTVCQECDGRLADEDVPPGTLMGFAFDPAGLQDRTPEEIFAASVVRAMQKFRMQMGGLCPDCSGRVDASLHVCDDHVADGICPECGRRDEIQARWICSVCKNHGHGPPGPNLMLHPRVVAFYATHDQLVGYDGTAFDDIVGMLLSMETHQHELVSTDPPRVRITITVDGDELELLVDETLSVVDE